MCEQDGHKNQQKQDHLKQVYQLLGGFRVSHIWLTEGRD